MRIGELATAAGVNIQTVRYYERRGILAKAERSESGHRLYDESIHVVRFVKRAQALGFSLDEISVPLDLRQIKSPRARMQELTAERIDAIEDKIAQLQAMRKALATLFDSCRHGRAGACPILEALNGKSDPPRVKKERRKR
jgi:MerR family mercuric resistance operon transcriptional regulator